MPTKASKELEAIGRTWSKFRRELSTHFTKTSKGCLDRTGKAFCSRTRTPCLMDRCPEIIRAIIEENKG